jgi:hypothetical protein
MLQQAVYIVTTWLLKLATVTAVRDELRNETAASALLSGVNTGRPHPRPRGTPTRPTRKASTPIMHDPQLRPCLFSSPADLR